MTNFIECKELTLQSAIGTSDTTIVVTGAYRYDGTIITEDDFGGAGEIVYATIEPKTDRQESLACTWVSNVAGVMTMTVTRALSGVAPYGTGGVAYNHSAGSAFIFTDSAALFNKLTAKDNDEVVTGAWEFPTPTTNPNPATKEYVDTELSDLDATLVHTTGAETIAGEKTFSTSPKIPDSAAADEAVTRGELDAEEVKLTGNQTIAGTKTFSSSPVVPDATSAQHPLTKAQYDAGATAYLSDASPTQQGATKIDTVADTPSDPVALTATADRVAALVGGGDFGTPDAGNKFITEDYLTANRAIKETLTTFQPINGSTTPVPVLIDDDGTLLISDANVTGLNVFHGFVSDNLSTQTPAVFLNSNTYSATGGSFTLNAGIDRVLYITFLYTVTSGSPTLPTSVSWNGNTLTKVSASESVSGTSACVTYRYIAGTDVSGSTGTISFSGDGGTNLTRYVYADSYQFVDQTTPEINPNKIASVGSTSSLAITVTPTESYSLIIYGIVNQTGLPITLDSKLSQRHAISNSAKYGDGYVKISSLKTITSTYSSITEINNAFILALKNSVSTSAPIAVGGLLSGFTGLTPGANYYVQDTEGTIGTSAGSTSLRCCKAITATTVLITQI